MRHDPCHVANYFINRSLKEGGEFTPLQIQKLVFFAHAWMLGLHHRPLVEREFEAWTHGPVMPAIYHNLSYYGGDPVTRQILARETPFDEHEESILSQVYDIYGKFDGLQLSAMSHTPGGPWDKTWRKYNRQAVIPDGLIEQYFANIYRCRASQGA
jgi:uncharacterized phage-associated protein